MVDMLVSKTVSKGQFSYIIKVVFPTRKVKVFFLLVFVLFAQILAQVL
jgi:hypothetical protein